MLPQESGQRKQNLKQQRMGDFFNSWFSNNQSDKLSGEIVATSGYNGVREKSALRSCVKNESKCVQMK